MPGDLLYSWILDRETDCLPRQHGDTLSLDPIALLFFFFSKASSIFGESLRPLNVWEKGISDVKDDKFRSAAPTTWEAMSTILDESYRICLFCGETSTISSARSPMPSRVPIANSMIRGHLKRQAVLPKSGY